MYADAAPVESCVLKRTCHAFAEIGNEYWVAVTSRASITAPLARPLMPLGTP